MAERLPLTLQAYRLLTLAATPLAPMVLSHRLKRGKEDALRLAERRGEAVVPRPAGRLVWIHGASVGELTAVIPLIERILARDFRVLATSGTIGSAQLAEQRLPAGAIHQFVPLDAPRFVARFLDHWRPDLALFAESDLWPNLVLSSAARGIPMFLVNGRLSERSFRRWRSLPRTIASLLRHFDLCLAQSQTDAARYGQLGAPAVVTTGNLKLDVPAPSADAASLAALRSAIGGRTVIAAASTHAGEEDAMIDVHRRLRHSFPGLLTIIVPRHVDRGRGIADSAASSGLRAVVRSSGSLPSGDTDIYVADTLGELGLTYRLGDIVFMGGSLVSHGGQNPIEAIKLGAAILHGPHVGNFAEIYSALDAAGGAEEVRDASNLSVSIGAWLTDGAARRRAADAAKGAIAPLCGALEHTLAALDPYLMLFRIQTGQDHA